MRKNKINYLLWIFCLIFSIVLYSIGIRSANAAEKCQTYINYYLFLDATDISLFDDAFQDENLWVRETTSDVYSLNLPAGAEKISEGKVSISLDGEDSLKNMTLKTFYEMWSDTKENEVYSNDGGITNYLRGSVWFENGESSGQGEDLPSTYSAFESATPDGFGYPIIELDYGIDSIQLSIQRTWAPEDVEHIESGNVYSPAIYYIEYEVCEKEQTLTINFGTNNDCSEGTNIRNSETFEYFADTSIKYSIPKIDGYDFSNVGLVSPSFSTVLSSNNSLLSFNMPSKNASICLVYIKNPQTGMGWIYLIWFIGIIALGYSVWYFIRYYKNRNNEI